MNSYSEPIKIGCMSDMSKCGTLISCCLCRISPHKFTFANIPLSLFNVMRRRINNKFGWFSLNLYNIFTAVMLCPKKYVTRRNEVCNNQIPPDSKHATVNKKIGQENEKNTFICDDSWLWEKRKALSGMMFDDHMNYVLESGRYACYGQG